jgi:hypothetical protein
VEQSGANSNCFQFESWGNSSACGRYTYRMESRENFILDVAVLVREAAAMGDAALAMDLDEARLPPTDPLPLTRAFPLPV